MITTSVDNPQNRTTAERTSGIAPSLTEIASVGGIFFLNILAGILLSVDSYRIINIISPLLLSVTLAYGIRQMLAFNKRNLWTALLWFRLSTIAYFGVGVVFVYLIDDASFDYIQSFFRFYDDDILKINTIVSLSVFLILGSSWIFAYLFYPKHSISYMEKRDDLSLLLVGTAILTIGLLVNYGVKVPQDFGWITAQVPGSILALVRLTMAGIFLLTLWSIRRPGTLLPYGIAFLVLIEMIFQLLRFSKLGILMTLIFFLMAFLWDKLTFRRAVTAALIVIGTYSAVVPVVNYGRDEIAMRYGPTTPVGFSERYDVLEAYFTDQADVFRGNAARQSAMLRITYVNAAAFVVHQFDVGAPGTWPQLIPATFVPRFFWPDKPIISDVGLNIYELGTGNRSSSMSAGVFAEAYWAGGWWGILFFMPIMGVILASLTIICSRLLERERWLYFPVILMGLQIGFRADGHYLVDIVGGSVIVYAELLLLSLIDWYLKTGSRAPALRLRPAPKEHSRT
jgi:hypothetical protein